MKEIHYIKHQDLDVSKYDACIEHAVNSRIYAYSWYLDCVADNWDVLVYGDYEAVMPLPWRKKFLISYVYTPSWVQQLGVFSQNKLSDKQIQGFIDNIPGRFRKVSLYLNEENKVKTEFVSERANFLLDLNKDYQQITGNYQKNRRQALTKALEFETKIKIAENPNEILKIHRDFILPKTNLTLNDIKKLELLLSNFTVNQNVFYYESWKNDSLLGGAIFLSDKHRFYYLLSAVNEKGKEMQSMSTILDAFIKNHSNTNKIFDFEGSTIPGIASFFKSFGAKKIAYYFLQKPFRLF